MCLKYCVPLAAIGFIGATAWQYLDLPTGNTLVDAPRYEHHEMWTDGLSKNESDVETEAEAVESVEEVQTPHANDKVTDASSVTVKTVPVSVEKGGDQ